MIYNSRVFQARLFHKCLRSDKKRLLYLRKADKCAVISTHSKIQAHISTLNKLTIRQSLRVKLFIVIVYSRLTLISYQTPKINIPVIIE